MSIVSVVLQGIPTTTLLKSLSQGWGGAIMGLRADWLEGIPVHEFELPGLGLEDDEARLLSLLAWADANDVTVALYETDLPLPDDRTRRPKPETRQYVLNVIAGCHDTLRRIRETDGLVDGDD